MDPQTHNKEACPIREWSENSLANDGCIVSFTTRYDLTIQDVNCHFLETIYEDVVGHLQDHNLWLLGEPVVAKTPLARAAAMMFSRFRGGPAEFRSALMQI